MTVAIHDREDREKEARLNEYRLDLGMTINEFCQEVGICINEYIALNNGSVSPVYLAGSKAGSLKPTVEKLVQYLDVKPHDLFPRYFCQIGEDKDILPEQLPLIMRRETNEDYETREFIEEFIYRKLTPIEEYVFCERIVEEEVLHIIGFRLNVTNERIRQIEAKALRKLKIMMKEEGYAESLGL